MPPKKARFGNLAKAAKENAVGKAIDMMSAATVTMTAAMDHDPTGGMTGTMTGAATAAPGTMVDATTDGALAPMAHPRPIQGTAIVLSHR